jgi:hypothetical protein
MKRCGVVVLLLCGLSAANVFAKPGVIKTTDGQTYSGEIDESNPETITVISAAKIPTAVPRNRIKTIEYSADFEKKFRDRLSKLDPKDVPNRMKLAREAYDNRQYVLARDAAEQARQIDPNNPEAADLVNSINSQIRLERSQQQQPPGGAPGGRGDTTGGGGAGAISGGGEATTTQPTADRLLKPDQINAIRQGELRPDEPGVRIRFERDVKKRFMEYTGRTPQEINQMSTNDLVQEIIKKGTPEMRSDVIIQNDPRALLEFRQKVQPFVLNNCATAGCHGAVQPSKFSLITPADSEAAMYTNFYTLQRHIKRLPAVGDNVFGRGELRLIDRQMPGQSLLLQYGLPPAIAELDHPEVPNYRAPYRGFNDARYQQTLRWISETLVPVPPDYGFTVGPAPASQAVTQPTPPPPPPAHPAPPGQRPPGAAQPPPQPHPAPTGAAPGTGARPAR